MPNSEDFYFDLAAMWLHRGVSEPQPFEEKKICIQVSQAYSSLAQTIILRKIQIACISKD